jgi:CheY-like chemotaxis protein
MTDQKTVLLVDDDREVAIPFEIALQRAGYRTLLAKDGVEGQRQVESQHPHVVITDMMMPKMGGFPFLDFIKALPNPPITIMLTAHPGKRPLDWAEHYYKVSAFLRKGKVDPAGLVELITCLLDGRKDVYAKDGILRWSKDARNRIDD